MKRVRFKYFVDDFICKDVDHIKMDLTIVLYHTVDASTTLDVEDTIKSIYYPNGYNPMDHVVNKAISYEENQ